MGQFVDLTGKRFGRLLVVGRGEDYVSPKGYCAVNWICKCDCGNETLVRGCNLKSGASESCGCIRVDNPNRTTHGLSHTRIHSIWQGMKDRCYNTNSYSFNLYGSRNITICDEWLNNFESFYKWSMENGYDDSLSIDRIDNSLGYSPENCRWADSITQANNKRDNHILEFDGRALTMKQWSEETGIKYQKLKDRINRCGWSVARALTTP